MAWESCLYASRQVSGITASLRITSDRDGPRSKLGLRDIAGVELLTPEVEEVQY